MKKNMTFFTLPTIISAIVSLFLMPIYTLHLDPVHYGFVASVVVILGVIDGFSDVGSGWVLSTYFHNKKINRRQLTFNLIVINAIFRIGVVALFFFFSELIMQALIPNSVSNIKDIYHLILLSKLLLIMSNVGVAYLILNKDAIYFFVFQVISLVICQSVGLWLVLKLGYKAEALAMIEVLKSIISLCLYSIYLLPKVTFKVDFNIIRDSMKIGFPALIKTPSSYLLGNIEKFFLQYFIGPLQLGLFNHGSNYKNYQNVLGKSFNRVYGADFIEKYTKNEFDIKRHTWFGVRWLSMNFLLSLGIVLFIGNFIDTLTHGKFIQSRIIAELMFVATYVQCINTFYSHIIVVEKKTKFIASSSLFIGIISTVAVIFGILKYGWVGAVLGVLVGAILSPFITVLKVRQLIGYTFLIREHMIFLSLIVIAFVLRQQLDSVLGLDILIILIAIYVFIGISFTWRLNLLSLILKKQKKLT